MPFRKVTEIWRGWGQHWEMKELGFIDDRARTSVAASQSGLQSHYPEWVGTRTLLSQAMCMTLYWGNTI